MDIRDNEMLLSFLLEKADEEGGVTSVAQCVVEHLDWLLESLRRNGELQADEHWDWLISTLVEDTSRPISISKLRYHLWLNLAADLSSGTYSRIEQVNLWLIAELDAQKQFLWIKRPTMWRLELTEDAKWHSQASIKVKMSVERLTGRAFGTSSPRVQIPEAKDPRTRKLACR